MTSSTSIRATACRRGADMEWDPHAEVPDWVVLGRIRERLLAGVPVPESVCPRDEVPAYVPALVAAGHTPSEISIATGVNAARILKRTP